MMQLTSLDTGLDQVPEVAFLCVPVDVLAPIGLEECERWNVYPRRKGSSLVHCHGPVVSRLSCFG